MLAKKIVGVNGNARLSLPSLQIGKIQRARRKARRDIFKNSEYFILKAYHKGASTFVRILRRDASRFKGVTVHGLIRVWQKCGRVTPRVRYFLPSGKKAGDKNV